MENFKTSKFLRDCIEERNDDYIAKLYVDISKTKVVCVDTKHYMFYKFNTDICIYELIGMNDFISIMKNELDAYISEVQKINTDIRLKELKTYILNYSTSNNVAKSCCTKLFDKTFENKLNCNLDEFHFKNGYVNLRNGEFHKRTKESLISRCNNYDYMENSTDELEKVIKSINKTIKNICNDDEDVKELNNYWFGYCLTGESNLQFCLFSVGLRASNGKSTLAEMFYKSFKNYCYKLKRESIEKGGKGIDKALASAIHTRFIYIEELEERLNTALFKDIVNGQTINYEVMYGTTAEIKITFKLNIISNYLFDANADRGVQRRGRLIQFTNEFLDDYDESYVPNKKGIYLVDRNLIPNFDNPLYCNALFRIYLPYAIQYYKDNRQIKNCKYLSTAFTDFKSVCNENDKMKQFIDSTFVRTDSKLDKIHKDHFSTMFNTQFKYNHKWIKILSDAKRCGVDYSADCSCVYNGISSRGVFFGLKLKEGNETDEPSPLDEGIEPTKPGVDNYKELFEKMRQENENLQLQIKDLQKQIKHQPKETIIFKEKNDKPITLEDKIDEAVIEKQFKSTKKNKSTLKPVQEKIHSDDDLEDLFNALTK